jgi:peroxiredoxin
LKSDLEEFSFTAHSTPHEETMSQVGTAAPDFTLKNTGRDDISLSGLRGKNVVLAFFPAAFTGVCEKELCTFRDSMSILNELNATVLGISADSPFANGAFSTKNELNFDILSDYSRSAINAYDVALNDFAGMTGYTASQRAVFIVDVSGTIRYRWVGANPGIEPDYDEIKSELAKL